jgi:hypothetical protein
MFFDNSIPGLAQVIERSKIGIAQASKKTLRGLDETLDCAVQRR